MAVHELDSLRAEIDEMLPDIVALRRDLHEHPELAYEEVRTAGIIAGRLRALGLEVETGVAKTGVVGLLRGGAGDGRTLAIRADMDALPIHELNEIEYRSTVEGKMHACGHDGHVSIALAVAALLSRRREQLKGNVKFLFQPAEEVIGGAAAMVQAGVMQDVSAVIGLHLFSAYPVGRVGVRSGPVFAAADRFTLRVRGKGGHAAMPEGAVDPIVIAAQIVLALQTLVSRETSPFERAVVTVASLHAGSAFNIIPEEAELQGTLRTFNQAHRERLIERIAEVARGVAAALRGSCEVEFADGCLACVNDPTMTAVVRRAAQAAVGAERVDEDERVMTSGSDDMAYFLAAAPGCYFIVGARNEAREAAYPHHHPRFNIDEDALPVAVEVLTRTALDYLQP
jgi:amidohydrolase